MHQRTRIRGLALLALLALGALAGCEKHKPVPAPVLRAYATPQVVHRAVLQVEDVEGLLVTAQVRYVVTNRGACVPLDHTRALGGYRPGIAHTISVPVDRIDQNTYEVRYFADYLKDEDYYGRGVCHWSSNPILTVDHAGTKYTVVNNRKLAPGQSERKSCLPGKVGTHSSCAPMAYEGQPEPEGTFHLTLTEWGD